MRTAKHLTAVMLTLVCLTAAERAEACGGYGQYLQTDPVVLAALSDDAVQVNIAIRRLAERGPEGMSVLARHRRYYAAMMQRHTAGVEHLHRLLKRPDLDAAMTTSLQRDVIRLEGEAARYQAYVARLDAVIAWLKSRSTATA